ncbi:tetraacyldisaccharide 4'-kinase [Shinella kummerowiae]|uniref:Tetraacyldisaccharide 4'-kinase n=1 Tax=Shinella kummerowiae TaxID=417745 RepID=A0A6N8SH99_9HYPH|nr:tetraacyldisaccharide 4'-kinase [Shinella kummerowiae]MXN48179.1 tetraacyldisaccharide 4'-kinase [Shinella kummerowiae]
MVSEAPPFWWTKPDWRAYALWPVSRLYGLVAGQRMRKKRRGEVPVPVICVGNFTVGGAGKTPTAIAIARAAKARGLKPGFLSRGYGGSLDVTTVVDPHHHYARAVGDEPLLLAREALTVIARKRIKGAKKLVEEGADLIIMDDGFQSAQLSFDYALLVIDTRRGIGNGHLVPSGPVRAPLAEQMRQASALLAIGDGNAADRLIRQAARAGKAVHSATLVTVGAEDLEGQVVMAWSGIADNEKFFRTVNETGAHLYVTRSFPDHHYLSDDEVAEILDHAEGLSYQLVTTSKDSVRLAGGHGRSEELKEKSRVIEVEIHFDDPKGPDAIIDAAIANARRRKLQGSKAVGNRQ